MDLWQQKSPFIHEQDERALLTNSSAVPPDLLYYKAARYTFPCGNGRKPSESTLWLNHVSVCHSKAIFPYFYRMGSHHPHSL